MSVDWLDFRPGYFDHALTNLDDIIERAAHDLRNVEFDTIVGTGLSGSVVVPALAMWMDVNYILVRKDGEDSHHTGPMVGVLGKRWIFVDDFISTGATRTRVLSAIAGAVARRNDHWRDWDSNNLFQTNYVGDYLYVDALQDSQGFYPMNANMGYRSEEHTSELQSHVNLVCRLLLEKKK